MLDSQISASPHCPLLSAGGAPEILARSATRPRIVVPRRPLRLAPPRDDVAAEMRQPLVALNIFSDVFDSDAPPDGPAKLDARVAASRRRIQRKLTAPAGGIAPAEANFWHISVYDDSAAPPPTARDGRPANDIPDLPVPLHEHLTRVRHALYADGSDRAETASQSTQMRLATYAMNATLLVVVFPAGAAVTVYSLLRGSDIRVSAKAMAIVAAVTGVWQSGLERLL